MYELGVLRALDDCVDGLNLNRLDTYVGVSSGAFIAAGLANNINSAQMCRIFINANSREHPFKPELFLRPAWKEYQRRLADLPGALTDALLTFFRNPTAMPITEAISQLARVIPSGLFDNAKVQAFLREIFTLPGRTDVFTELEAKLVVVAVDLDTGLAVRFGEEGHRQVPISRAVQASSALPGLFPPVEIDGRCYVDGALRRTLHASVALDRGCDLLIAINPLVTFDSREYARVHGGTEPSKLVRGGLPTVLSQTFRALIQSRMNVGLEKYATRYPAADFMLVQPNPDDAKLFFTNVFSYAYRKRLCEHAYQDTRAKLRRHRERIAPVLECHELSLCNENLCDPERQFDSDVDSVRGSTNRYTSRLSSTLDDLDDWLRHAANS